MSPCGTLCTDMQSDHHRGAAFAAACLGVTCCYTVYACSWEWVTHSQLRPLSAVFESVQSSPLPVP